MNESKSTRVTLTGNSASDLKQMLVEARSGSSTDLTSSQLASWVLSRYFKTAFSRDMGLIRKEYFNPRKHLREALRDSSSDEDFKNILRSTINQLGEANRKKEQKK